MRLIWSNQNESLANIRLCTLMVLWHHIFMTDDWYDIVLLWLWRCPQITYGGFCQCRCVLYVYVAFWPTKKFGFPCHIMVDFSSYVSHQVTTKLPLHVSDHCSTSSCAYCRRQLAFVYTHLTSVHDISYSVLSFISINMRLIRWLHSISNTCYISDEHNLFNSHWQCAIQSWSVSHMEVSVPKQTVFSTSLFIVF